MSAGAPPRDARAAGRRAFVVDTAASIAFFSMAASVSELLIAGLALGQVLGARLAAIPIMLLTARPYGLWRDAIFRRVRPRREIGRTVVDTAAFITFQLPVYALTLALLGADLTQIAAAASSALVFMIALSRPFGLYLDAVRRLAGTAPSAPA